MLSLGKSFLKCTAAESGVSMWVPATEEDIAVNSANCVSGGREFGQGAIISAGTADLKCSRGIWYPIEQ